ncbi:MAG: hypothetical protein KDC39_11955 [Actinobacteria bacterium]|nr:hypothetical protein [Actinomycetota bacterium]
MIVTSTSKDLTADTARTIAALHTTGRECILVTDQQPPDTIGQWLPDHACITSATIDDSSSDPKPATNASGETLEEAMKTIQDPHCAEVRGMIMTEDWSEYHEDDFLDAARRTLHHVPVQLIPDRWTVWGGKPWDWRFGDWGDYDWYRQNLLGSYWWDQSVLAMLHFRIAGVDSLGAIVEPEESGGVLQGLWLNGSSVAIRDRAEGNGKVYEWQHLTGMHAFAWLGSLVPPPLPPQLGPTTSAYQLIAEGLEAFLVNLGQLLLDWGTVNLPPPLVVDSFNTFWKALTSEDLLT